MTKNTCITFATLCILCGCFLTCCYSEIYTSIAEMEDLFEDVRRTIKQDINVLKDVTGKDRKRKNISRNVQKLEGFSDIILHPNFTVRHPINAYMFLQNISNAYDSTVQATLLKHGIDINKRVFSKLTSSEDDIESIQMAILRIQRTYDLQADDILAGNINGHKSNQVLKDCFRFVALARSGNRTTLFSNKWLEACIKVVGTDFTSIVSVDSCKEALEEFVQNGMYTEAARICERLIEIEPDKRDYKDRLKQLQKIIHNKRTLAIYIPKHPLIETQNNLCQGVDLKTPSKRQSKHLVCKLVHDHPLLKLQPGRAELRSRDPHIVIYHNFLSKTEMNNIKAKAKQNMKRATVNYRNEEDQATKPGKRSSPLRTCKNAFVDMTRPPFTVAQKMEALTGLKTGSFLNADTQIANYGVGGHYFIHSDFYGPENMHLDERLATFMFYLSDVESGGATVFLPAKETIYPEEGVAVFWYNTYRNGTVNPNTQHAACPVAVGNKWIGTFWVRMNRQEFTKPCSIKKDQQYWPFH